MEPGATVCPVERRYVPSGSTRPPAITQPSVSVRPSGRRNPCVRVSRSLKVTPSTQMTPLLSGIVSPATGAVRPSVE